MHHEWKVQAVDADDDNITENCSQTNHRIDWDYAIHTVEPHFTDTCLTPHYYGLFSLSLEKVHTFFQNLTCLIWTPVNTDN